MSTQVMNITDQCNLCYKIVFTTKAIQTKEDTTLKKDNVISLEKPEETPDLLTGLLESGVRELITQAVHAELIEFLTRYEDVTDSLVREQVVRNGYLPQREIMIGIGPVDIQVPKARDKGGQGLHFRAELLPPHIKRTKSAETVLPRLCLNR